MKMEQSQRLRQRDTKMTKKEVRDLVKDKRSRLSADEVKMASQIICEKIALLKEYREAKTIFLYSSIKNEIDMSYLCNQALDDKKVVCYPKVFGPEMKFIKIDNLNQLCPGAMNILEPEGELFVEKPDLVIFPGLAFTKDGKRLGFGGGFYDKYFENIDSYKLGVCYEFQIFNELPCEEHDVTLNRIITND